MKHDLFGAGLLCPLTCGLMLWLVVEGEQGEQAVSLCAVLISARMFLVYCWFNALYVLVIYRTVTVGYATYGLGGGEQRPGQQHGLVQHGKLDLKLMKISFWVFTAGLVLVAYGNMPLSRQVSTTARHCRFPDPPNTNKLNTNKFNTNKFNTNKFNTVTNSIQISSIL